MILSTVIYGLEDFSGIRVGLETVAHETQRVTGIGPVSPAWKAGTLPLSYTRLLA